MGFDRLEKRRANRTRTWASLCVGLFCSDDSVTDERADADASDEAT